MRVSHPPSRLSPPPGASMTDLFAAAGNDPQTDVSSPVPSKRKGEDDKVPKRGYRACVHCRLRKAKCDLGDVNAPSEPPCTRCRREQRNCIFLPSKRRRKTTNDDSKPEVYASGAASGQPQGFSQPSAGPSQGSRPQMPGQMVVDSSFAPRSGHSGTTMPGIAASLGARGSTTAATWQDGVATFETKQSPMFDPPTNSSIASGSTQSPSNPSTGGSSRRKRHSEPDATRRIVVASFNNETDALEILAKAATDADDEPTEKEEGEQRERKRVAWADNRRRPLSEFILIKRGILDERKLELLVNVFFTHHHPVLPIFQTVRIPHNHSQLAALAHEDPFLLSVIVCVASRHHPDHGMKDVHDNAYALVRETISEYTCGGLQTSIGFVEGVLILAENLPREQRSSSAAEMVGSGSTSSEVHGLHGSDNRRSWALTGTAIRAAYGLGLDQLALEDGERDAELERARGVWTWCYLFDRTLGLRTGLAFWSRGPTLCFQGISDISQTGEAAARVNFPYMMQPPGELGDTDTIAFAQSPSSLVDANDSASMMQAYTELTQIMTNAHDILFSTPSRTSALVRKGEYFKFLDHFRRALESFCVVWKDKVWRLDAVKELTWCTYHFVRLYVAAFAFQAHVQRAQERAEREREIKEREGRPLPNGTGGVTIFPRGSATSPDAVYIYESIDAAHEILGICLRLGHSGVLQYLPSRYLINFAYSGTFALKAAYSGAVAKGDIAKTTELVERVCAALLLASPDKDHPACRFGTMLRLLSRRLTELSDQSAVPSRFPSPEPSQTPDVPSNLMEPPPAPQAPPGADGFFDLEQLQPALFDVPLDVGFNLDGFWDDFTLTDSGGFPFR